MGLTYLFGSTLTFGFRGLRFKPHWEIKIFLFRFWVPISWLSFMQRFSEPLVTILSCTHQTVIYVLIKCYALLCMTKVLDINYLVFFLLIFIQSTMSDHIKLSMWHHLPLKERNEKENTALTSELSFSTGTFLIN